MPGGRPRSKDHTVDEAVQTTKPKAKSKPVAGSTAFEVPKLFDLPKFTMPNFELPKIEVPADFREFAEKSVSQVKETYEKMKSTAEEANAVLENTYAIATKGASDYGLKVIEATRVNTNSAFDFCTELMTVKSLSEMIQLSTAHSRKQFEATAAQTKELAALAQKVTTESFEPVKESFAKALKGAA
jgi:phasin